MSWLFKPIASLRLTLVLLTLSLVLVFLGTMAQEPLGLYLAQDRFFQSTFVDFASMVAAVKKSLQMVRIYLPPSSAADVLSAPYIPVYPGGYLLGALLVVNLLAAHATRFRFSWKKSGIVLVHAGLVLLLLGQLFTDLLARESAMRIKEGETRSYSESDRRPELVVIKPSSSDRERVVAIPDRLLSTGASIQPPEVPFSIQILRYYPNSTLTTNRSASDAPAITRGFGAGFVPVGLPRVTEMDVRDVPSAVVELRSSEGSLGTFLVSEHFNRTEEFTYRDTTYTIGLRPQRHYNDFSLQLLDFRHDKYPGTDKPKNFSSEVRLRNPATGEDRQVLIRMNEPLRYKGQTYYQMSWIGEDTTVLQVVHNPAWLTPYFACVVVGAGLMVQFGIHLIAFLRRKPAPVVPAAA